MKKDEIRSDDLTTITGIGTTRQKWLAEAFGVHTFADLASLSVDEIAETLAADRKPFSYDEVQSWINESKEQVLRFVKKTFEVDSFTDLATMPAARIRSKLRAAGESYSRSEVTYWKNKAEQLASNWESYGSPDDEAHPNDTSNSPGEKAEPAAAASTNTTSKDWQRIVFVQVEYKGRQNGSKIERRTLIYLYDKEENILADHEWSHIETKQIGRWIEENAGDMLHYRMDEVGEAKTKQETLPKLSLSIVGIRLYQPVGKVVSEASRNNGRPHFGVVQADLPFGVEADFVLGEEANGSKHEISYQAQFYAQNRKTGEKMHLGDAKPSQMISGAVVSASLKRTALPAGSYRLQALVAADLESIAPDYFELPILEVV